MRKESLAIRYEEMGTDIPYYVFEGKEPGPHFMLSAGMHGDEINGIAIVSRFLQWFQDEKVEEKMKGKLTVVPVLNPSGFAHMQRRVFEDGKDLNRCFGVDEITTYSEFYAKELVEKLFHDVDYGIDVHDSWDRDVLLPHSRIHRCDKDVCVRCTRRMGELMDTDIIIERDWDDGMFAVSMDRLFNVPLLTLEVWWAQTIFDLRYDDVFRGLKNNFIEFGLLEWDVVLKNQPAFLLDRYELRTLKGWQVNFFFSLWDEITCWDVVVSFFDPLEQSWEDVVAPVSGVLFSRWFDEQVPIDISLLTLLAVDSSQEDVLLSYSSDYVSLRKYIM